MTTRSHTSHALCTFRKLATLTAFLGACALASAQIQLLNYGFNEGSGSTANSTGTVANASIWGNGGTVTWVRGVSDSSSDFAVRIGPDGSTRFNTGFDLSLSNALYMNSQMQSFTLSGWINPTQNQGAFGRILDLTANTNNGIILGTSSDNGLMLSVNGSNVTADLDYALNQWTFFAITYDGTLESNNVRVYAGTTSATPELVATLTLNQGTVLAPTNQDNRAILLGNNNSNNRPYVGLIDNLSLYGALDGSAALSLNQGDLNINSLYTSVLIPEASTYGFIIALGALMAIAVRQRSAARSHATRNISHKE